MKKIYLLFSGILLLSGCVFQNYLELYSSDLYQFMLKKNLSILNVNGLVKIEVSGEESCNEKREIILNLIKNYIREIGETACKSEDMKTFFQVKGKLPIYKSKTELLKSEYLLAFTIGEEKKRLGLTLFLNKDSLDSINHYTKSEFWATFEAKDFSLEIEFQNDIENKIRLTCRSCYISNKPFPFEGTEDLNKRDKVKLKTSQILMESIMAKGSDMIFELEKL